MKISLILIALLISLTSHAAPRILAFSGEHFSFPATIGCFFSNNRLAMGEEELLVNYTCFFPEMHGEIWGISTEGTRSIVTASANNLLSDPVVIDGHVYSAEYSESNPQCLWEVSKTESLCHPVPETGMVSLQGLAPIGPRDLLFRFTDAQRVTHEGRWTKGAWQTIPARGISYYFSAGSSSKIVLQKVRLGNAGDLAESQPDEIQVRLLPALEPITVVKDRDADSASPYISFRNYSIVNGERWTVTAQTKNGPVALVGERRTFVEVPLYNDFSDVDNWPHSVTTSGVLVFRATHRDGRRGLWSWSTLGFTQILNQDTAIAAPNGNNAYVSQPMFYNAPLIMGERTYIGIGLSDSIGGSLIGQGIVEIELGH